MTVEKTLLDEYPFVGEFYTFGIDYDKPLNERSEEKKIVLKTKCDIQEYSKSDSSGIITDSFSVYFPFKQDEAINVKRGMMFTGFFTVLRSTAL